MTYVNPGKAQQVAISAEESFEEYSRRVVLRRYPIKFRDEVDEEGHVIKEGEPIVLNPESEYSFVTLELERRLSTEEFGAVFTAIMTAIGQFEAAGYLPPGLVKGVSTPFDLIPPQVPQRFTEELEENEELKLLVSGEIGYELKKIKKPVIDLEEEPEFEEEPEDE